MALAENRQLHQRVQIIVSKSKAGWARGDAASSSPCPPAAPKGHTAGLRTSDRWDSLCRPPGGTPRSPSPPLAPPWALPCPGLCPSCLTAPDSRDQAPVCLANRCPLTAPQAAFVWLTRRLNVCLLQCLHFKVRRFYIKSWIFGLS